MPREDRQDLSESYIKEKIIEPILDQFGTSALTSQISELSNSAIPYRYKQQHYDFTDLNNFSFNNVDGTSANPWTVSDNAITTVITTNESFCWFKEKIQDGKISAVWENPSTTQGANGWVGFAFRGKDKRNSLLAVINCGPSTNNVGLYSFVNGSRAFTLLKQVTMTTDDTKLKDNTPVQMEVEFYGKYVSVRVNGKIIIDKYTDNNILNANNGLVGLACSLASGGMTISNVVIKEKMYDVIPSNFDKILCAGDSIVFGSGSSNPSTTAWVPKLRDKLKTFRSDIEVVNVGVGGNNSGEVLNNQILPNLNGGYDIIIVLCGTNDGRIDKVTAIDVAIANMTKIIKQIKSVNAIPIVCTPTPYVHDINTYFPTSYDNTSYWYNVKLVGMIRQLCAKEKIRIVDNYDAFNNNFTLLSNDKLHPNDTGYDLIYNNVLNVILNNYDSNYIV